MTREGRLRPDQAVRLLRAKAGELETMVQAGWSEHPMSPAHPHRLLDLAGWVALMADLLADHIEREHEP